MSVFCWYFSDGAVILVSRASLWQLFDKKPYKSWGTSSQQPPAVQWWTRVSPNVRHTARSVPFSSLLSISGYITLYYFETTIRATKAIKNLHAYYQIESLMQTSLLVFYQFSRSKLVVGQIMNLNIQRAAPGERQSNIYKGELPADKTLVLEGRRL